MAKVEKLAADARGKYNKFWLTQKAFKQAALPIGVSSLQALPSWTKLERDPRRKTLVSEQANVQGNALGA